MSKGHKQRKRQVPLEQYENNHDRIFKDKNNESSNDTIHIQKDTTREGDPKEKESTRKLLQQTDKKE